MTEYLARAFERPYYAHCVWNAAVLGKRLGYEAISAAEFGVAGGNGLVLLEKYASEVSSELGIEIQVYGFDTAEGLPTPVDYRDLPHYWKPGAFHMDVDALRGRLTSAKLVLGDIRETASSFFEKYEPAPLGAVFHDMDLYTSTKAGLEMFRADEKYKLPRIFCFFDDIFGDELTLISDYTGERLAIREFNDENEHMKICPAYYLHIREIFPGSPYIHIFHDFAHSKYNDFVGPSNQELPLGPSL